MKTFVRAAIALLALPLVACTNNGLPNVAPGGVSPKPVGYVYATLLNVNAVLEIDNLQSRVTHDPIQVPGGPVALAIDPRSIQQYLYVVCSLGNTLTVVDRRNRLINRSINVGANPQGIAVTANGQNAFVTNQDAGTISVIDTSRMAVSQTISLGAVGSAVRPQGITVSADGTRVYVACMSGQVAILQGTPGSAYTLLPLVTLPGAIAPQNIAVAAVSGANRVFITDPQSNNLFVLTDNGQPSQAQALPLPGAPTGVAVGVNPRTGQADGLFVTASQSNAIYSIDLQSLTPSAPVQVEGSDPTSVVVSSLDDEVYVSLSGSNNVGVFKRVGSSNLSRPQQYNLNNLDPKYISPTGGIALGGYLGGS